MIKIVSKKEWQSMQNTIESHNRTLRTLIQAGKKMNETDRQMLELIEKVDKK